MADIKNQQEGQDAEPLAPGDKARGEEAVRQGIELLFFAYRDFTAEPDAILERHGFGRARRTWRRIEATALSTAGGAGPARGRASR